MGKRHRAYCLKENKWLGNGYVKRRSEAEAVGNAHRRANKTHFIKIFSTPRKKADRKLQGVMQFKVPKKYRNNETA